MRTHCPSCGSVSRQLRANCTHVFHDGRQEAPATSDRLLLLVTTIVVLAAVVGMLIVR